MAEISIVFTDNLQEVLKGLDNSLEKGLVDIGAAAQGYAKDNTPVRRGVLRDSIGVEVKPNDKEVYIGTMIDKFPPDEEPYGKYVELGARGISGKHMLQRAATEHPEEYKAIMEDNMKNA